MPRREAVVAPRKIPVQARSRDTVAAILEAAAQILEKRGEDAVTTNAVAERAGFSIGTLYQYFPDRDAVLLALAERERKRIADRMMGFFETIDDAIVRKEPSERLRDLVRALIQSFARRRGARRQFALMVSMIDAREPKDDRKIDRFSDMLIAAWKRVGADQGASLDKARAFVMTRAVIGVLRSAALEDFELMKDPSFEDALLLLITSFGAGPVGNVPSKSGRQGPTGSTPRMARQATGTP